MPNTIWLAMLLIAVLVGGFSARLEEMTGGAFKEAADTVMKIAPPLIGAMAIWLGMMRLAERSGLVAIPRARASPRHAPPFPRRAAR